MLPTEQNKRTFLLEPIDLALLACDLLPPLSLSVFSLSFGIAGDDV
jgi:hypothetical protein